MGGVDRRQILQGAAWAAPVVAVSTAVPATSASSPVYLGHLSASDSGSVKEIGGSTVYLRLNVAVSSDTRVPVNSVLTAAVSLLIDNPLRASDYEVNAVPTGWTQTSSGTLATHTFTPAGHSRRLRVDSSCRSRTDRLRLLPEMGGSGATDDRPSCLLATGFPGFRSREHQCLGCPLRMTPR